MLTSLSAPQVSANTNAPRFSGLFLMKAPLLVREGCEAHQGPKNDGKRTVRRRFLENARGLLEQGESRALQDLPKDRVQGAAFPPTGLGAPILLGPETRLARYQLAQQIREGIPNGNNLVKLIFPADGMPAKLGKKHQGTPQTRPFFLVEASGVHANDFMARVSQAVLGATGQRELATTRAFFTGVYPDTDGRTTKAHVAEFKDELKKKLKRPLTAVANDLMTLFTQTDNIKPKPGAPTIQPHAAVTNHRDGFAKDWAVLHVPDPAFDPHGPKIYAPVYVKPIS